MSGFLANTLLVIHFVFIAFVVVGFVMTVIGFFWKWRWIHNFWFRILHLCAILLVVLEAWFGAMCPLTVLEGDFREAAAGAGYSEPFVTYWLQRLIYHDFAPWVFTLVYTVFGALVVLTWVFVPPRWTRNKMK